MEQHENEFCPKGSREGVRSIQNIPRPVPYQCPATALPVHYHCPTIALPLAYHCHTSALPLPHPCPTPALPLQSRSSFNIEYIPIPSLPLPYRCPTIALPLPSRALVFLNGFTDNGLKVGRIRSV